MGNGGGESVLGERMKPMFYINFNPEFKPPGYHPREEGSGVVGGGGGQLYWWTDPPNPSPPPPRRRCPRLVAPSPRKKPRTKSLAPLPPASLSSSPVVAVSHSMVGFAVAAAGNWGEGETVKEDEECGFGWGGRKRSTAAVASQSSSLDCVAGLNGNAAVSERQRRKVMGDSLVALLSLLPNAHQSRKMDKCTILGKAETYITSLQEQLESLKERKNTLHLIAKQKCKMTEDEDVTANVVQSLMKSPTTTEPSQHDLNESTLFNVYVNRFNGTELFITLSAIPEQKNLFTRILSLVENSKIEIVNSTLWQEDGLSNLMLYGKIDKGLHLPIELLKNKFFSTFSSPNSCGNRGCK